MKIGRITKITAAGLERNATLADTPETTFCSIASPAVPIAKTTVTSFQLHSSKVGLWLAFSLLGLFTVMAIFIHGLFQFATTVILISLLGVLYLVARYYRLTLYSVIVHISDSTTPRINFYRTFQAFDFVVAMDWLTRSVGDRPRTYTGAMKRPEDRDL